MWTTLQFLRMGRLLELCGKLRDHGGCDGRGLGNFMGGNSEIERHACKCHGETWICLGELVDSADKLVNAVRKLESYWRGIETWESREQTRRWKLGKTWRQTCKCHGANLGNMGGGRLLQLRKRLENGVCAWW